MSTSTKSTVAKLAGGIAAAATLTVIAIVAHAAGHDDFARGAVIGGAITLVAVVILWIRGARGGAAARLASGVADERERRLFRDAGADAAIAMFAAAIGGSIWALFDAPAIAVAGIVLWAGLITFVASAVVRARRG